MSAGTQPIKIEITGTANSIDAFFRNNLERIDTISLSPRPNGIACASDFFARAVKDFCNTGSTVTIRVAIKFTARISMWHRRLMDTTPITLFTAASLGVETDGPD